MSKKNIFCQPTVFFFKRSTNFYQHEIDTFMYKKRWYILLEYTRMVSEGYKIVSEEYKIVF